MTDRRGTPQRRLLRLPLVSPLARPLTGRAAALIGVFVGLLGVLAFASPASAHAALVRTSPVQGSIVQQAPSEIVITFSEHVTAVSSKIAVIGPDGKKVNTGNARVSGVDLRIPVRTDVPRGTYLVSYRVISADSHPVGAGFSYSVGAPSQNAPVPTSATDAGSTSPGVAIGLAASRYLGYAGLILVAGPALVLAALWPHRLDRTRPTRMAYLGLGAIGLATLLELYLEAPYSNGTGLFGAMGELGGVLSSTFGLAHLVRLGTVLVAAVALRPFLAGRAGAPTRALLLMLSVVAVGTWAVSGHPGTSSAPLLTVIADAAHLASMAIWIGGLLMLTLFLLRRANARELSVILPVWSNWAALAVLVLVLAGTAQALIEIGTVNELVDSTYGRLVIAKIILLGGVMAAAALSRRFVTRVVVAGAPAVPVPVGAAREPLPDAVPATGGDGVAGGDGLTGGDDLDGMDDLAGRDDMAGAPVVRTGVLRRMRMSVLVEVLGAVLIIGAAAALVQTTPGHTIADTAATQGSSGIYSTTLTSPLYQLQLDIEPARQGNNDIHLYAYGPTGVPLAVKEWTVSAALPSRGVEPISVPVLAITDTHATASVSLPTAGSWEFSFTLRTTDIDEATVRTTVPVR